MFLEPLCGRGFALGARTQVSRCLNLSSFCFDPFALTDLSVTPAVPLRAMATEMMTMIKVIDAKVEAEAQLAGPPRSSCQL